MCHRFILYFVETGMITEDIHVTANRPANVTCGYSGLSLVFYYIAQVICGGPYKSRGMKS